MTILHLIRSYGKKVPGGAEINIDYLVNFIYKSEGIISIVLGDNGVWIFNKNSSMSFLVIVTSQSSDAIDNRLASNIDC